jgi:hypothetical protein
VHERGEDKGRNKMRTVSRTENNSMTEGSIEG